MSKKQIDVYRTGIYLRLSQGDEDVDGLEKKESNSISNQKLLLEGFIDAHDDLKLVDIFIDDGYSGSNFDRPEFQRMMASMKEGNLDCIIVKDLSRLARERIGADELIQKTFKKYNMRFIAVSEGYDSLTASSSETHTIIPFKNLLNDMYAKDISKRVSVSRRLDMERGKFTGSNAPYGYKVDSGDALRKYVIDRDAAAVVRQIFELAADGVTLREIAKALQEYRLALPGDYLKTGNLYVEEGTEAKSWYPGTISNILKNQAYIGNMVQGKRRISLYDNEARHATDENDWIVVENTHEAIVDKELFNKVRAVMDKKVEESIFTSDRGKNLPIKEDIFAGILFCGNCGRRIPLASRILEKDGVLERQYFYSCRYNYDFGGKQCGCTIMEQELIKVVHNLLTTQIAVMTDSARTEASMRCVMDRELKNHDMRIQKFQKQIDRKNYEESKEYQSYVTGEITKADFKCRQEKNADAIMRLRGQISDEEASRRRVKRFCEKKIQWLKAIYRFQSEVTLDRNMIKILVDSIYLYPDKRLVINLNFKDEYARMTDGEEI